MKGQGSHGVGSNRSIPERFAPQNLGVMQAGAVEEAGGRRRQKGDALGLTPPSCPPQQLPTGQASQNTQQTYGWQWMTATGQKTLHARCSRIVRKMQGSFLSKDCVQIHGTATVRKGPW